MMYWLHTPVLTDAPAMCFAVLAALLPWPFNVIVALIGGFARETVPVFAALYAWSLWPLIALIPIGAWALFAPEGADPIKRESWLARPFKTAMEFKHGEWREFGAMVTPWGGALAALAFPSPHLFATIAVAYAQLVVATDFTRLFVWAAPVVVLHAAQVPVEWMLPLAVFHITNPWRGAGT